MKFGFWNQWRHIGLDGQIDLCTISWKIKGELDFFGNNTAFSLELTLLGFGFMIYKEIL